MTLQFPNNPSNGQSFKASNNLVYVWDGEKWITQGSAEANSGGFLPLTGGNLTGPLTSTSSATFAGNVIGKQQFEANTTYGVTYVAGSSQNGLTITGTDGSTVKTALGWNGSASFGAYVNSPNFYADNDAAGDSAFVAALDGTTSASIFADGSASFVGGRTKVASDGNLELYNGANQVAAISAGDGSATFADGDITFGGTGSATFKGAASFGGTSIGALSDKGTQIYSQEGIATVTATGTQGWDLYQIGVTTPGVRLTASGSGAFADAITSDRYILATQDTVGGAVLCNGYPFAGYQASAGNNFGITTSWIEASGNATFTGKVTANNVTFSLDTGATLDVKGRLQNTQAVLLRIKAALIQPDADANTLRARLLEALDILVDDDE